ncbi:helix-turn-helix transcriptional regulator [Actinoplanes missouriensis]|uniref:helix-turn-helix domain-containing protein n=1 Tax=Actinoplanes missouriensis TaxID=1866 RepID=UPI003410F438
MSGELARRVGLLLQATRIKARRSQERLAVEAGTSQQWISRVERGTTDLRLGRIEALFAVLGTRLVVETAPRPDPRLKDLLTATEAAAELAAFVDYTGIIWKRLADVPHVVSGRLSALAQGLPVRPTRLDLLIAESDTDRASRAFATLSMARWDDRLQEYLDHRPDIAGPGPLRWFAGGLVEMRVQVVPCLPAALTVTVGDRRLMLVPLAVLLDSDPDVADLQARVRHVGG